MAVRHALQCVFIADCVNWVWNHGFWQEQAFQKIRFFLRRGTLFSGCKTR